MSQTIGILSIQGAYFKHKIALDHLGVDSLYVNSVDSLESVDKLIIPGGESTAMITLLKKHAMWEPLKEFCAKHPVFGTCAGAILMAKKSYGLEKLGADTTLGLMDMEVQRNSYGRQLDSFRTTISVDFAGVDKKVEAIFIRAPAIISLDKSKVDALSFLDSQPVLVRQGVYLAAAFHPELTDDLSIHEYFAGF